MPFITQGKTNWKLLFIIIVLATVVGGGILWFLQQQIPSYQPLEIKIPEKSKTETNDWKSPENVSTETTDWESYVVESNYFKDKYVTALAVADNNLYVASKESTSTYELYILDLKDNFIRDVSDKLVTSDKDTITQIRVDRIKKELWIETNGNGLVSDCYDYNLNIKKRYSNANSTSRDDPQREFIESQFIELPEIPSGNSIETIAFDDLQAVVGFFKGDIYLYSFKNKKYEMVYKPTNIYYWPISSVLSKDFAFVGTRGDGLIVIDRSNGKWKRYYSHADYDIQSLATDDEYVYIGARGLFAGKIKDFNFVQY